MKELGHIMKSGGEKGFVRPKVIVCPKCKEVLEYKPRFGRMKCKRCGKVILLGEVKW